MTNRTPVFVMVSNRGRQCHCFDQISGINLPHHLRQRCLINDYNNNAFKCLFILDMGSFGSQINKDSFCRNLKSEAFCRYGKIIAAFFNVD